MSSRAYTLASPCFRKSGRLSRLPAGQSAASCLGEVAWCESATSFFTVFGHAVHRRGLATVTKGKREAAPASKVSESPDTQCSPRHQTSKDADELSVAHLVRRYALLRPEDRLKLVQAHERKAASEVKSWERFRAQNVDDQLLSWANEKRERQEQTERLRRIREMYKPAHLRRRKQKVKRVQQLEEEAPAVVAANFTEQAQTLSLVEDIHKAEVYEQICAKLDRRWKAQDPLSDRFSDILTQALREDLMDQSRPTLVNEFTDFDNPYMLKREALKRLLEERGTRNALDESVIDKYLNRRSDLVKLRLGAKLPPEVVEPLAAFHGLTTYSFDKRTRLGQKADAIKRAVDAAHRGMDKVLEGMPENQRSDLIHKNHPFCNHFGFVSAVPWGTVGSVTMGAEKGVVEKELERIRYPTLQRVAHTLPKDPKYRAVVAHAIRVLERSSGWDFESKVKAINTLIEVYNELPPSAVYERKLDEAFPVLRSPGMTRQTQSRNSVYCRGLKYIRSLTTQKPLHVRLAKKK